MFLISFGADELLGLGQVRGSRSRLVAILLHLHFYFAVAILLVERARVLWGFWNHGAEESWKQSVIRLLTAHTGDVPAENRVRRTQYRVA